MSYSARVSATVRNCDIHAKIFHLLFNLTQIETSVFIPVLDQWYVFEAEILNGCFVRGLKLDALTAK
ncbi:UNVERIFIED_CONTAM: hypothetical protein NCL1_35150 [Trichonephila clavipes]